jgi:hypothetical protein
MYSVAFLNSLTREWNIKGFMVPWQLRLSWSWHPMGSKRLCPAEDGEVVLWPISLCLFSEDLGAMECGTSPEFLVAFVSSQSWQKPVTSIYLFSFPFVQCSTQGGPWLLWLRTPCHSACILRLLSHSGLVHGRERTVKSPCLHLHVNYVPLTTLKSFLYSEKTKNQLRGKAGPWGRTGRQVFVLQNKRYCQLCILVHYLIICKMGPTELCSEVCCENEVRQIKTPLGNVLRQQSYYY